MKQISLADIKAAPQNFFYIFATDGFLAKLDKSTAKKIADKRTKQAKIINNACVKEGANYNEVAAAINSSLKENFGHSGVECLKILASGGQIAGKNWKAGIYGIGETYEGFKGTDVTVNPDTGRIMQGGKEISGQTAIYGENSTTYTAVVNGVTYTSQYGSGKYSAGTYTDADGKTYNATGAEVGIAGTNNIWTAIQSYMPLVQQIINWLASLFPNAFTGTTTITAENTIPSQSDGFVQKSSIGWVPAILLTGLAVGYFTHGKGKKQNK